MANLTVETIETGDGVLEFLREGRKLVAVSFQHVTKAARIAKAQENDLDIDKCHFCGTMVVSHRGSWYDLADRFLCRQSPSSMHKVSA